MHLHWIDWLCVAVPLAGLILLALRTRRYVRGAADFIAAGRCAGRYLLANARGEAGSGVTNTVSWFEVFMVSGFITVFWSKLSIPLALILGITGFCVYRYRETRALTVAQFYEMRYSRGFRLFMGFLAFLAGVLNYGIFPAVSARFFIYFLNLDPHFSIPLHLPGTWTLDLKLLAIHQGAVVVPMVTAFMAVYMALSCGLILFGGQVTLIVTDCVEGILSHAIYLVIIVAIFFIVSWEQVMDVLTGSVPLGTPDWLAKAIQIQPGHSPVNPFDAFDTTDFNFWYVMLGFVGMVYGVMSWQGGHGFNSAARTPHEGRMGNVLGRWRDYARSLVLVVLVIGAMTYLRHPDFAAKSLPVKQEVSHIAVPAGAAPAPEKDLHAVGGQRWFENKAQVPQLQRQQITSVTLRHMLPVGLAGMFLLLMILGLFAGDGNHLHSWSSIFIQDVVLPLRGEKPLTPRAHLRLLRSSVVGVAIFAFLFSALVPLKMPIWMWWAITGAVYNTGAGAVIIGGLYWRRGTSAGAWTTMILGSTLSLSAILLDYFWKDIIRAMGATGSGATYVAPTLLGIPFPERMWLNQAWHGFLIMCVAATSYVVVSLLTSKGPFNMDWLLKRGQYRVDFDHEGEREAVRPSLVQRMIGIDRTFTRRDKVVSASIFWWSMFCVGLNLALVFWHYVIGYIWPAVQMENRAWAYFWLWYGLIIPFGFAAVTLVWFGIGGIIDLKHFFHTLDTMQRDSHDDGTVQARPAPAGAQGFEVEAKEQPVGAERK